MGTRSIVAIPEGDGWKGRYVHWDGYPMGVGKNIWNIVQRDGLDKAVQTLVYDNNAWSSIGYLADDNPEWVTSAELVPGYGIANPEDTDWWIHATDDDKSWCEWFYVASPGGLLIGYLQGDKYVPCNLAFIPWNADTPDFQAIQDLAYQPTDGTR